MYNLINLLISESEYIYRVVSLLNGLSCGMTFLSEKLTIKKVTKLRSRVLSVFSVVGVQAFRDALNL